MLSVAEPTWLDSRERVLPRRNDVNGQNVCMEDGLAQLDFFLLLFPMMVGPSTSVC